MYPSSTALILTGFLSFVLSLPMRVFFRTLFYSLRNSSNPRSRSFSGSPRMSSSATAAALYAATVSSSQITGAVPGEIKEKRHHLKDGKGFTNPWDSWREMSGPTIMKAMIWYVNQTTTSFLAKSLRGDVSQGPAINPIQHLHPSQSENPNSSPPEKPPPFAQHGSATPATSSNFQVVSASSSTLYSASDVVRSAGLAPSVIQTSRAKSKIYPTLMLWSYLIVTMTIWITRL